MPVWWILALELAFVGGWTIFNFDYGAFMVTKNLRLNVCAPSEARADKESARASIVRICCNPYKRLMICSSREMNLIEHTCVHVFRALHCLLCLKVLNAWQIQTKRMFHRAKRNDLSMMRAGRVPLQPPRAVSVLRLVRGSRPGPISIPTSATQPSCPLP